MGTNGAELEADDLLMSFIVTFRLQLNKIEFPLFPFHCHVKLNLHQVLFPVKLSEATEKLKELLFLIQPFEISRTWIIMDLHKILIL